MGESSPFTSRFEIDDATRVCVVSLAGHLDSSGVDDLHPQVQELVRAGVRHFVFDMTKLDHIGSLGLRLLVGLSSQLKSGGSVSLCSVSNNARSVFEMTKLTQILSTFPTRAAALEAARGG